jgi:hypothetical protein
MCLTYLSFASTEHAGIMFVISLTQSACGIYFFVQYFCSTLFGLCCFYFTFSCCFRISIRQPQKRAFFINRLSVLIERPCLTLLSQFFFKDSPSLILYAVCLHYLCHCFHMFGLILTQLCCYCIC